MNDAEFKNKMNELGWNNDYIDSILKIRDEAKKDGIVTPLGMHLIEAPRNYP